MPRKLFEWRAKLPCRGPGRDLSAYLDGELAADDRAAVERHLGACPRCRVEYDQLRFASRALTHFTMPEMSAPPFRQAEQPWAALRQSAPHASPLGRFWATKIAVPAPAVAALAATIILAVALFAGRAARTQTPPRLPPAGPPATVETRIIEVPVEREVVRERVVTRYIHARQPRPLQAPAVGTKRRAPQLAERAPAANIGTGDGNKTTGARASLEGFRPAADAKLRIVKEPK
ncbi:MAG: anti-sigma factor family protein [Pyrinomonadaceae bacterium]